MDEKQFKRKYPNADTSRFLFDTVPINSTEYDHNVYFITKDNEYIDITSDEFKNNSKYTKFLIPSPPFPLIWKSGGTIQPLPKGIKHRPSHYKPRGYYDDFPHEVILNYPVNNFRIYVNERDWFLSKLPPLKITTDKKDLSWNLKESYYQTLVGAWVACFASGVSIEHLTPNDNTPKQITSFMRFHLYFTIRRIMRELTMSSGDSVMRRYNAEFLKTGEHNPRTTWQEIEGTEDIHHSVTKWHGANIEDVKNDYKKFIPRTSNGFTKTGQLLLNQSIEAYVYSILGAQARTKQSIVGSRASAFETQKVFRQIVEDSVINYDTSTWINNMNKALTDTNVTLDLAISPTLWLVPSDMVILKNPIPGYNNKLKVVEAGMRFGVNDGINYHKPIIKPKKVHTTGGHHLETLELPVPVPPIPTPVPVPPIPTPPVDYLIPTLVASAIGGYVVSRYVL